jgi:tryptophanyl-tRNA synthetase
VSAVIDLTAAAVQAPGFVVSAPYSQVHIPALDADDHIIMRARQLSAILRVMPVADYSEQMIQLLRQLAEDLVKAIKRADGGPLLASQLAELLLMVQGEEGPCDMLWLCQQIANEIDETMSGMLSAGCTV